MASLRTTVSARVPGKSRDASSRGFFAPMRHRPEVPLHRHPDRPLSGRSSWGVAGWVRRCWQDVPTKKLMRDQAFRRPRNSDAPADSPRTPILASLGHPNIARLIDGGMLDDGTPFIVMEYATGFPLRHTRTASACR